MKQKPTHLSDQDWAELQDLVEANHPFTTITALLFQHQNGEERVSVDELYDRVIQLSVVTFKDMVSPEVLTEIEKEIPEMLKEQPDVDETDLWVSLIASDINIMPMLLPQMSKFLSKITYDMKFDQGEEMYKAIDDYIETYKNSSDNLFQQ